MSKGISGFFSGTKGEKQALIDEVISNGYKITPKDIVGIVKDSSGKVIWLEKGHLGGKPSGLVHIMEHESDFNRKGIKSADIPDFVLTTAAKGEIVGYQGKGTGRPIYQITYKGKTYKVAITIGSNGYIVGANPR